MQVKAPITWEDFSKIDMRTGTVVDAQPFAEAIKPAIKLWIDFAAPIGLLKTSAQVTDHYTPEQLIGRQVVAVVNFPAKQIGKFMSQCLVLGAIGSNGDVMLLAADPTAHNGAQIA